MALQDGGNFLVGVFPGSFDPGLISEIEAFLAGKAPGGPPELILLDFSALTYINSTGVGALIQLFGVLRPQKRKLAIFGCQDNVKKIFKLVNLQRFIPLHPDRETALGTAK